MLACVTVFFNPVGYSRILANYYKFVENFPKSIPLYTVEASYSGHFETDATFKIKANPNNQIMWQKERLINLVVDWLPDKFDRYMYSDCDILYEKGFDKKVIESDGIVQNFCEIEFLNQNGVVIDKKNSALKWMLDKCGTYGSPGASWTYPREIKQYERAVVGAGDSCIERALIEKEKIWSQTIMNDYELAYYYQWSDNLRERSKKYSLSYLDVKVQHLFHGTRENRNYIGRHQVLKDFKYNPIVDVQIAKNGLLSWSSYKPQMHEKIKSYFFERQEDQ